MPVLIKDIKRNNNEIIRIEVSEFKGKELINIRIWYQAIDNVSGDLIYKPTQKGVALNITEFEELRDGINKLGLYIEDQVAGTQPEQPEEMVKREISEDELETEDDDDETDDK